MSDKKRILESWIMVEHLSEGDIKKNDKKLLGFEDLEQKDPEQKASESYDYYSFLQTKLQEKRFRKGQKGGLAVFFDVFDFKTVITFLRKKYNLPAPEEEVRYGTKYRLALYFDKNLELLSDMTFFTVSGYIRCFKKVPQAEEFREFEAELKTKLEQLFEDADAEKFNTAFRKVLCMQGGEIDISSCRVQLLNNVESEAGNLHSFFIEDLEKAKKISTGNLDLYLTGKASERVNLDTDKESPNFDPAVLKSILNPRNYPLGRFPSNTEYFLSFMQQIAVNLSIGYDSSQIRSVNGPPGTGKTTLLKDIFAELVVEQAMDICNLEQKLIKGSEKTRYFDKASIGVLPEHIAEKNIVVASCNNGAVQNIVNELPLIKDIDKALIDELKEADYFREISNSSISMEWKDGKPVTQITPKEELFWGLFSLEGGKADNMTNILSNLKEIVHCFNDDFDDDDGIYDEFKKQYAKVADLRRRAQSFADAYEHSASDRQAYIERLSSYSKDKANREVHFDAVRARSSEVTERYRTEAGRLQAALQELQETASANEQHKNEYTQYLQMLESQKPGFFAGRGVKEQHRRNVTEAQTELMQMMQKGMQYTKQIQEMRQEIDTLRSQILQEERTVQNMRRNLDAWTHKSEDDIRRLQDAAEAADRMFAQNDIRPIQLNLPYDDLQVSNPWFDQQYRIAQSKLFITALRVRKQFLFENRKNLNAAVIIWNKQKDYTDRRVVIEAAWHWINMAVPVISSTFASFGRMCRNLGEDTLGHLFIDEAGQALPQAAVGAIFRSRHVMVVGDPAQIKPVLTLESNVLGLLGKHFHVSEKYLSESASTQTLVDAVSRYGYYREKEKTDSSWIGIPLWVHRRCQYPMFTISNKISYNGLMVQADSKYGKTGWYDVKGKAKDKYVDEQGEFLYQKIAEMIEQNPVIIDKNEKDTIYIISPFSNVAYQLSRKLKKLKFTRFDEQGKPTNIGTIHTFQGKEAPIVFMVLGADRQSSGAARWAVTEPNMMNVAATRAKKEFYIVGDKELYLGLGCEVVNDTYRVMRQYKKEHPDLFFELEEKPAEKTDET